MEQESGKKNRISNKAAALLIGSAIIADLLTLIPIVGIIVGPTYWVLINIYLFKSGFGFMNGKRLAASGVSAIAEIIPAIQALPTITLAMIIIVVTTRIEDKTGISVGSLSSGPHLNSGGVRRAAQKQQPLNQGGTRPPNGGLKN
ncbi:MAG: hypothetical protein KBC33_01830 [Candidatus Pacebacteria bacterium]|nr:hypothetical protein [Candidatus Paceibacterota bacterium]